MPVLAGGAMGQSAFFEMLRERDKNKKDDTNILTPRTTARSASSYKEKSPIGSVSTTRTTITPPSGPAPTLGPAPVFQLPKRDEARIRRLQQEAAAPGVRELRRSTRQALLRHLNIPGNRAVQAELTRGLLAGHGDTLSKVMGQARQQGRAEYEAEYAPQVMKAKQEFGAAQEARIAQFQAAWKNYMNQFQKTVTQSQKNIYSNYGSGGGGTVSRVGTFVPNPSITRAAANAPYGLPESIAL
jgi:hypothetical protein